MSKSAETLANWGGSRITLSRFWEGEPLGRMGTFRGLVLTVYKILKGNVLLRKGDVTASAQRGEWIVCHPGERFQQFTDSAYILSLHFHVESPVNAARWIGAPLVVFKSTPEIDRCINRMRRTNVLRHLDIDGRLNPEEVPSSLDGMLELRGEIISFFRLLMKTTSSHGMKYEASPIHDSRVRESRGRLATADLRQKFSRAALAREFGLSACQLDRLWREELDETPRHYWNHRRLEAACSLLLANRLGKEVAYATGFQHLSQFSLWFRANMGESPQEYQFRHQ